MNPVLIAALLVAPAPVEAPATGSTGPTHEQARGVAPGLSTDGYYLLVSPGLLAFDVRYPDFRAYAWGVSGGRLFTGAGHFAAMVGGFFEHNLWINRIDPNNGQHARRLSFLRLGPELRIGGSGERVFAYGLVRAGLDVIAPGPVASFMAGAGLGV